MSRRFAVRALWLGCAAAGALALFEACGSDAEVDDSSAEPTQTMALMMVDE
jgi:hypothetical protein